MPRRESIDDGDPGAGGNGAMLRPPAAGRSRPFSAGSAGRASPYLSNTAFANSTSSLSSLGRSADVHHHVEGVGGMSQNGLNLASEPPFLATAEMHLGRMTLTAPDNMRRRKAEEKEKKRKARKAAAVGAEAGPSRAMAPPSAASLLQNAGTTNGDILKARKRPQMPTSRSSSNLQTLYTVQAQRPSSPTRAPPRPRSAQNATRGSSPERRAASAVAPSRRDGESRRARNVRRPRAGSRAAQNGTSGEEGGQQTSSRRRISSGRASEAEVIGERCAVRAEALRRATQRRRDIYADLSALGLPGASDSETEESPPPPFPQNATRPISPPPQPAEGQEWTEAMRRRQEEYLNNRPPDSPPPAFQSDNETANNRREVSYGSRSSNSGIGTSSDEEGVDHSVSEAQRLWEADAAAGIPLEQRIRRQQERQKAKELTDSPTQAQSVLPNSNLGQLVTQARDRRKRDDFVRDRNGTQAVEQVEHGHRPIPADHLAAARRKHHVSSSSLHRRAASDDQGQVNANTANGVSAVAEPAAHRNVNAAVGTGKGLIKAESSHEMMTMRGKVTKIRPRPASESHSRFRDDASAAANRRLALWGTEAATASTSALETTLHGANLPKVLERALELQERACKPDEEATRASRPSRLERKHTSSSSGGADVESSDSEAEWAKEEKEFQRMQNEKLAETQAVVDSSEDEEGSDEENMPGSMPQFSRQPVEDLPELGRIGKTIPRAPPPLVLGRSRGGAAYSSSSESSSDSDSRHRPDDEDSDSESPVEVDEMGASIHSQDLLTNAVPPSSSGKVDKGKQPMRPLPELPLISQESQTFHSDSDGVSLKRAGSFVEDTSSSHEFSHEDDEDDEDDGAPVDESRSTRSQDTADFRAPVQNRLKGLFASQLSPHSGAIQSESGTNPSRSGLDRLFDTGLDGKSYAGERRPSVASRDPSDGDHDHQSRRSSAKGHVDPETLRDAEHIQGASRSSRPNITSPTPAQMYMTEQRARSEALDSLSQLQRSRQPLPAGVDRDSLTALERLLARTTYASTGPQTSSFSAAQPLIDEPRKLTRSGAISNRHSGAFVNPRTVNAPRPLGRLPTITDATRHFPPSQRMENGSSTNGDVTHFRHRPSSTIGTPSWMAYIPTHERRALPIPIEPDRRVVGHADSLPRVPSPPAKGTGSRVSAMIERFEQRRSEDVGTLRSRSPQRMMSPTPKHVEVVSGESDKYVEASGEVPLRRRPPPPPPPQSSVVLDAASRQAQTNVARPLGLSADVGQQSLQCDTDSVPNSFPVLPPRPSFVSTKTNAELEEERGGISPSVNVSPAISIFGNLYTAEERSRSSNSLFGGGTSRPLPVPPRLGQADADASSSGPVRSAHEEMLARTAPSTQEHEQHFVTPLSHNEESEATETRPADTDPRATTSDTVTTSSHPRRAPSLGITDLDVFASRLADVRTSQQQQQQDGEQSAEGGSGEREPDELDGRDRYDDLHLLAEFLGPAKAPGLTQEEMATLPVGRVEVLRRRVVGKREDGRDKVKLALAVAGVKVERCGVCLVQFKQENMACVFPCLHVFHERCASTLLRNTKLCPTCRTPVI